MFTLLYYDVTNKHESKILLDFFCVIYILRGLVLIIVTWWDEPGEIGSYLDN